MSNYTCDNRSCRVDFWKESGRWYTTGTIIFDSKDWQDTLIHVAFKRALEKACPNNYHGMRATCLEPHHKNSHPISILWEG